MRKANDDFVVAAGVQPTVMRNDSMLLRLARHVMALLYKHFVHSSYNWRSYLSFFILPNILFVLAMLFMMYKPDTENEPKLELAPEIYGKTHAFFRFVQIFE